MTWLFENPFWILFLGISLTIGFAFAWVKTARKEFGLASAITLILTVLLVMAGIMVETDREKIRLTVMAMSEAVEDNDVEGLVAFVSPKRTECRERIEAEMPSYVFDKCNVMSFNGLAYDAKKHPTRAMVVFFVWADVNAPTYGYDGNVRRRIILFFEKVESGEWLLYDYDHEDPGQASRYLNRDGPLEFVDGPTAGPNQY